MATYKDSFGNTLSTSDQSLRMDQPGSVENPYPPGFDLQKTSPIQTGPIQQPTGPMTKPGSTPGSQTVTHGLNVVGINKPTDFNYSEVNTSQPQPTTNNPLPTVNPTTPQSAGAVGINYPGASFTPNQAGQDAIQQGLANAQSSGQPAPQDGGAARSAVANNMPPAPQADPLQQAQSLLEQSPEYQQWTKDKQEADQTQQKSEVDFIQKALKDYNVEGINTELLNNQKIIDGTEDDIRNEVQAAGGFSTNSQVLALASARNKNLISRDNYLEQAKANAMNMVNMMSNAFVNDRNASQQALVQKLQLDQQALENRQKIISATQEGYKNIITAVGYSGLVNSLLNTDASGKTLATAESMLGFAPGQLQNIAQQEKNSSNLAIIQASGATSPYVLNAKGEVWDSSTGYAFTSPEDFQQKTGQSLQSVIAKGAIQKLPPNIEQQTKLAQMQKAQTDAKYAGAIDQANINQSNAAIHASNISAANSAYDLNFRQTHGGLTQSEFNSQIDAQNKQGQSLLDDAAGYIEKMSAKTNPMSWNTAWNALHTKYPEASTETLDSILQSQNYRK